MTHSSLFQHDGDTSWKTVSEGVQRQVFGFDDTLMMVKVKFNKGSVGPLHSHAHSQVSYVESGVFEMVMGDITKVIHKGDGYYVPPFTVHGCTCLEEGMLVDAFSPARSEFIAEEG